MARTTLTKTSAPGRYASNGQALISAAADVANGNQFVASGNELIIARNTDGANAHSVTIHSVNDPYNRSGNIAADSIPAGETKVYGPFPRLGWMQPDGRVYVNADNSAIEFAVIALP